MITITQLKKYVNYTDSDLDGYFQSIIDQTENFITEYCQQPIDETTVQEVRHGNNTVRIALPNTTPVSDLTVEYREVTGTTYSEVTGCSIVTIGGLPYVYNPNFFYTSRIYRFSYTAGWDIVPEALQRIAIEMSAVAYNEQSSGHGKGLVGLSSVSDNFSGVAKTTTFRNLWMDRWFRELTTYRVPTG